MTCLFLNTHDKAGTWLYGALKKNGIKNLVMISAEELVYASHFSCGIETDQTRFTIQLQNGLELSNQNVRTVLNRINYLPVTLFNRFKEEDRSYVNQEQIAIFTFLFTILPNQLFNTSSGRGLNGQYRSQLEWMQLAKKAGLTTIEMAYENFTTWQTPVSLNSQPATVLFFNGKCFGPSIQGNPLLNAGCKQLGILSTEKIVEMYFQVSNHSLLFTGASTVPSFHDAGDDFINELKQLL